MNDPGFDDALRQRHAEALTHLSLRTQLQLRNRPASPAVTRRPAHRMAWAAAACAALFALLVGLQMRPQPAPTAPQSNAYAVADNAVAANSAADSDTTFAIDENPDLYLWLASQDAVALASE